MAFRFHVSAFALLLVAGTVQAAGLVFEDPWIRAAPPGADVLAGYATLHNVGDTSLTITGGRSADFERVELHEMKMEAGVMKMREVKGIDVAANGKTELKPGGFHIMLVGLADGLKEGAKFPLKLKFEKAGEVTVQVTAEKPDAHGHGEHKH